MNPGRFSGGSAVRGILSIGVGAWGNRSLKAAAATQGR